MQRPTATPAPPSRPTFPHHDAPSTHQGETLQRPSTHVPATPQTPAGDTSILTGYEILGVLGRGGMGVVYKARQVGLNRVVALKMILSGGHASSDELMRFKVEAEAVAKLSHPNIVQVFDIGERDGKPFFSLEYCDGGSLQQTLDGTPMEPRKAAALLETLARAMHFAHERGIVHRDLKPANILMTSDGVPKITDFGLAKRLNEDQGQTGTEAILGTPTYMAPEQASGKAKAVGPRADIYALGAMFYDLLTGRPPFKGTTALDTIQLVQTAEPIPPGRLQPKVPGDVQTICLKCLEKEAAKRYSTALDLADDLRRFLEGRPIQARPASAVERLWKWAKRRPAVALAASLAILTPLVVAGLSVAFAVEMAKKNETLDLANGTLTEQAAKLEKQADDLEKRQDALEKSNVKLEKTNAALEDREKKLEGALTKVNQANASLQAALDRVTKAERDAQGSFLTALEAAEDLLSLARKELRKPGVEAIRQSLLKRAVSMCLRFTERPGDSPPAQLRAARAHRLAADLEAVLGNTEEAIKQYDLAVAAYEKLIGRGDEAALPSVDYEAELLETYIQYWGVLESVNPPAADKVMATLDARMSRVSAERRAGSTYTRLAGMWFLNRAVQHQLRGRPSLARDDYSRAMTELAKLGDRADVKVELARVRVNRAALLTAGRDRLATNLTQAKLDCEEAIRSLTPLVGGDDANAVEVLGQAYKNLALVQSLLKENDAALKTFEQAVTLFAGLLERAPRNVDYQHHLATARGDLGSHLLRSGQRDAARKEIAAARTALAELSKTFATSPGYRLDLARLATSEGLALLQARETSAAEGPLSEALKLLDQLHRELPRRPEVREYHVIAIRNLIFCHDQLARQAEARRDRRTADRHVARLVTLREEYEKSLPPLGPDAPWHKRAWRFCERLLAREELAGTLRARAEVLEASADHAGAARCVEGLRPLLAAEWPGWVESAALLSRCARMAGEDRALSETERRRLARRYGQQALDILAKAEPASLGRRLDGRDFDPLREMYRDEFKKIAERARR